MAVTNLHIVDHPVVQHMLAEAREAHTPPTRFRALLRTLGSLLAYEALRQTPQRTRRVMTPLQAMDSREIASPITVVPILRAGLGMAEGVLDLWPEAKVGHLGLFRNEATLEPVSYYERLPAAVSAGPVLLIDPMLATGGSACEAIRRLRSKGCTDLRFVCLVAAPPGVSRVNEMDATIPIYTASLDTQLNEHGYIVPGLGDAGDRLYGTGD